MFGDLPDNPLGVSVPVGAETLSAAAGASVLNAVLVCGVGAVLHSLMILRRWFAQQQQSDSILDTVARGVVTVMPASLLPGALAVPFGTLMQPGVGACVALMVSSARTGASVACGAIMLCIWAALPIYSVMSILVRGRRGRRDRKFALMSSSISHHQPTLKARARRESVSSTLLQTVVRIATAFHAYTMHEMHRWGLRPSVEYDVDRNHRRRQKQSEPSNNAAYREYASYLLENMEAVFGGYVGGREWYFAVDWGVALVGGAVMGGAEAASNDGDACAAALWGTWCAVVLGVVQVVALVALRPNRVRLELWSGIVLGLLSVVLSLAGADDAGGVVASVGSILEVVLLTVLMIVAVTNKIAMEKQRKEECSDGVLPLLRDRPNSTTTRATAGSSTSDKAITEEVTELLLSCEKDSGGIAFAFAIKSQRDRLQALLQLACRV